MCSDLRFGKVPVLVVLSVEGRAARRGLDAEVLHEGSRRRSTHSFLRLPGARGAPRCHYYPGPDGQVKTQRFTE